MSLFVKIENSLLLLIFICLQCYGHPLCLDFGSPFREITTLNFCSDYQYFGCCTQSMDTALQKRLDVVRNMSSSITFSGCETYIREILCLECSPYAAHIYDAKGKVEPKTFPGICIPYCRQLLTECRMVAQSLVSLYNDTNLLVKLQEGDKSFCQYVALKDEDYCYPDLETNGILSDFKPKLKSSEGCLCVEIFAEGLRFVVFARTAGDNSDRLFVGEKEGIIHVYYLNGTVLEQPFLDIEDIVWSGVDEKGLLSVAFHPNYSSNGRFFVCYTRKPVKDEAKQIENVLIVSEFTISESNENEANKSSERVLLELDQPFGNHQGGDMLFGDDGFLYIFTGDGGGNGDPYGNSQSTSSLLGKVLRLNIDVHGEKGYSIPDDNPFINDPRFLPEIYAYGLRNPWRCGKDKGDPDTGEGKGRIMCGDVGENANEEIDLIVKGGNYGWNSREGFECFKQETCGKIGKEELPVHTYSHSGGKCIIGGHFYRGRKIPRLSGSYIYGDFKTGQLNRLLQEPINNTWVNSEINICENDLCCGTLPYNFSLVHILGFGEDESGEIYALVKYDAGSTDLSGSVYKFVNPMSDGKLESCNLAGTNVGGNNLVRSGVDPLRVCAHYLLVHVLLLITCTCYK